MEFFNIDGNAAASALCTVLRAALAPTIPSEVSSDGIAFNKVEGVAVTADGVDLCIGDDQITPLGTVPFARFSVFDKPNCAAAAALSGENFITMFEAQRLNPLTPIAQTLQMCADLGTISDVLALVLCEKSGTAHACVDLCITLTDASNWSATVASGLGAATMTFDGTFSTKAAVADGEWTRVRVSHAVLNELLAGITSTPVVASTTSSFTRRLSLAVPNDMGPAVDTDGFAPKFQYVTDGGAVIYSAKPNDEIPVYQLALDGRWLTKRDTGDKIAFMAKEASFMAGGWCEFLHVEGNGDKPDKEFILHETQLPEVDFLSGVIGSDNKCTNVNTLGNYCGFLVEGDPMFARRDNLATMRPIYGPKEPVERPAPK